MMTRARCALFCAGCTFFPELRLRITPRKGQALLFFPAFLDGRRDPRALHAAEPAVGRKWVAQLLVRQPV